MADIAGMRDRHGATSPGPQGVRGRNSRQHRAARGARLGAAGLPRGGPAADLRVDRGRRFAPSSQPIGRERVDHRRGVNAAVSTALRPVALAIRNADFQDDRIFDLVSDGPVDQAPYTPWRLVRDLAQRTRVPGRNRRPGCHARDRSANGHGPRLRLAAAAQALVAAGARPGVLTSLEPPVIAWELYYRLPQLSARFPVAFLFGGAAERDRPGLHVSPVAFSAGRQTG